MSAKNDKPNPMKTGTGAKKKVISKGKKTESIVPDLNAASEDSAMCSSKIFEKLPSKNINAPGTSKAVEKLPSKNIYAPGTSKAVEKLPSKNINAPGTSKAVEKLPSKNINAPSGESAICPSKAVEKLSSKNVNAASGESAMNTSKSVENLPRKNVAKKSTKSSTKISKEYQDAQKSANTDFYINPKDLEKKCYVTKSAKSVNTGNSSKSEVVEEESCHQSGSDKDLKGKKLVKGPHNSGTKVSEKKLLKRLEINKYTNFMKDFDPEKSQREARKLENLPFPEKKKVHNDNRMFDENGIDIETGQDLCDCLIEECPGCHFPCSKCRSLKCGHVCRRNRTWCYDEIEIEGTGIIIKRKK